MGFKLRDSNKYTPYEIQINIEKLTNIMEDMKDKRSELTKQINDTSKQIKYWQELDESQLKMF